MSPFSAFIPKAWFSSIRTKLTTLITFLIGGISLFIFIYFPSRLEEQAINAIAAKAQSITEMTAFSVSSALFFEDIESIEEALEGTKRNKDLIYIVILDDSGRIIDAFDKVRAEQANFIQPEDNNRVSRDGMIYKAMAPIILNDRKIGQLYLGLSLTKLRTQVSRSKTAIASVSMLIFVIGIVAVFGISSLVIRPLTHMVKIVKQISDGDMKKRASVSSHDEVGHLASSFNMMVDNLQREMDERRRAEEELKKHRDHLEELVEERTAELTTANQKLIREITERKLAEARLAERTMQLQRTNKDLLRKNEEIESFYHTVSHELKTPLTSAREYVSLVLDKLAGPLTSEQREFLETSMESCDQMTLCINDLLDATRLQTGKLAVNPHPFSMDKLVQRVVALMAPAAEDKGISLQHVIEPDLPDVLIDEKRVAQVLTNLLDNALKFTPEGGEIVVKIGNSPRSLEFVLVSVSDTGRGIEPDRLGRIFDRLYQVKESDSMTQGGLGLGLSICQELVGLHGGEIWAESQPGKGSTFFFTVPKHLPREMVTSGTEKGGENEKDSDS